MSRAFLPNHFAFPTLSILSYSYSCAVCVTVIAISSFVVGTHESIGVLEEEQPLEASPMQVLGDPFPEEEVVDISMTVRFGLQREGVFLGEDQLGRAVAEGGDLVIPAKVVITIAYTRYIIHIYNPCNSVM